MTKDKVLLQLDDIEIFAKGISKIIENSKGKLSLDERGIILEKLRLICCVKYDLEDKVEKELD